MIGPPGWKDRGGALLIEPDGSEVGQLHTPLLQSQSTLTGGQVTDASEGTEKEKG